MLWFERGQTKFATFLQCLFGDASLLFSRLSFTYLTAPKLLLLQSLI